MYIEYAFWHVSVSSMREGMHGWICDEVEIMGSEASMMDTFYIEKTSPFDFNSVVQRNILAFHH